MPHTDTNNAAGTREQALTLLDHIGKIMDLSKEKGLDAAFFDNAKPSLEFVADELHINPVQAALFAKIAENSVVQIWDTSRDFFNSLKCSKSEYLKYLNEIDELVKLHYVTKKMNNEYSQYRIPRDIILALRKSRPIKPVNYENISIEKFFSRTDFLFESCCKDELAADEMADELDYLTRNNTHLEFLQKIRARNLNNADQILLLLFCSQYINSDETVSLSNIEKLFPSDDSHIAALKRRTHILQKLELIEHVNDEGFSIKERFTLTEKARDEFLADIKSRAPAKKDFILSSDIKEKQMFYNSGEDEQVRKLINLMLPENFKNIRERFVARGLRTGFACLFSGPPGTGKTETVYQIARQTGRDLMAVDASQIKSMWVGESEKHIKDIFIRYREHVKKADNAPILFFNEADAVIGRRAQFNNNSRAVDQMENTIQNIILQEMENLDGILIATTNLTQNMDKAFERRFLYKIQFGKPEIPVRKMLWKSMLPDLSDEECRVLSSRFNFSGGQIENITRKRTVDMILSGTEHELSKIIAYCEEETLDKNMKQYKELMFYLLWLSWFLYSGVMSKKN